MHDLTTGSLARHLLKTTGFMLVSMVFQTLYVLIDLYWVGRLGTQAVAAVAISGNLLFIVVGATQMLAVGTTALVSQAVGRKDRSRALLLFNQSQILSLVACALFMVIVMALRRPYASGLSADSATMALAITYLSWFIPAMGLQFALVGMAAALRGTGNFRPGMVVQTGTIILNLVLAPVLMFGWGTGRPLGVAGAAMATFISVAAGVVWLVMYFLPKTSYLKFLRAQSMPDLHVWRDILKIGLPAGAEFALLAAYLMVVYVVSQPFGAAAQAGFGIGMRIIQACFLPVVALGFAVAPVAGQNFGARQASRVRDTFTIAAKMAAAAMFVLALLVAYAGEPMIRIFSADPTVVAVGVEYLRIIAWNFVTSGIVFVCGSMFQAMGNTLPSLIASATRLALVAVPALILAALPGFTLRWVWILSVLATTVQTGMILLLLRREFRARLNFPTPAPTTQTAAEARAS
jgi:putative MATE family efflux protein